MTRPEQLLACTLTFRDATPRSEPLPLEFETVSDAVKEFMHVLMHEAHERLQTPLASPPLQPFLYPVDVDTDQPGIVDKRDEMHVLRRTQQLPRVVYTARPVESNVSFARQETDTNNVQPQEGEVIQRNLKEAQKQATQSIARELARAERKASTVEKNEEKKRLAKEARTNETVSEREARLTEARAIREQRKMARDQKHATEQGTEGQATPPEPPKKLSRAETTDESMPLDALLSTDVSMRAHMKPLRKRRKNNTSFFEHPLPHHRHLEGLQQCVPSSTLLPTLLHGVTSDQLEIVQGPPGTGKTRQLVEYLKRYPTQRIFCCAPTNVGAANLYNRCVQEGFGDEASLTLVPERVPLGTVVLSNDVTRRIVCSTISSRSGSSLNRQTFECIFVDEAAQCMEAWIWTLLRNSVTHLIMAGDTKQLSCIVSESGKRLRHERSLMERLEALGYENITELNIQNRMAPSILSLVNQRFYEGRLTTGEFAPLEGRTEIRIISGGMEESCGTSYMNRAEAKLVAELAAEDTSSVILSPYVAQCTLLLSYKTKREVHTIDSMQGRESDTVVLSTVRDGSKGIGFWEDERRLVVALTRARRRLVIVCSNPNSWPDASPLKQIVMAQNKVSS